MRQPRLAWSFLTRLPGGVHPDAGEPLVGAVPWFPAVGAVVGLVAGSVYAALDALVAEPIAGVAAVAVGALVTGAFHEDGLADTFDALGGSDPARRLEIMRDSRVGTFGVLALVVATLAKVGALGPLDRWDGLAALVGAHALGRAGALVVMVAGPEARRDGLAAGVADLPRTRVLAAAGVTGVAAVAIGPVTAVAGVAVFVVVGVMVPFARRAFGGVTGDVLGASEQIGEVVVLVTVASMVAEHGWLWA